eukprot:scaffold129821_cov21-Tisochrysis_lutea.AAC.1
MSCDATPPISLPTLLQLYGYPAQADRRSGLTSSGRLPPAVGFSRLQSIDSGPAGQQQGAPTTAGAAAFASASQGGQQGDVVEKGALCKGPDFVLCIGDDRSDEDMFTSIETMRASPQMMTSEVGEACCGVWCCYSGVVLCVVLSQFTLVTTSPNLWLI